MAEQIKLYSPAKINLYLRVIGRFPSGYHEIVTVMSKVSIYDEITVEFKGEGTTIVADDPEVPTGPENTMFRAIEFLRETGKSALDDVGISIHVKKGIPSGSGLGGASSNAASLLLSLNSALNLGLGKGELISIGEKIGADVPFFIFGSPALATGTGEILTKILGIPETWLVVVKPPESISTTEAYEKIDLGLTQQEKDTIIPKFDNTIKGLARLMTNDFEPIAGISIPGIAHIRDRLNGLGSPRAMMSGSGSSVFGIFEDEGRANNAFSRLSANPDWAVFLAKTLFD